MFPIIQLVFLNAKSCSHTELERSLLSRLHKAEQTRYDSFANLQRRRIWLAGRALLLAVLQRKLGQVDAASIRTDEQGGIRFEGEAIHLSLSHSRDMLVVSMSDVRTGVDIEWLQPRTVQEYAERVFNRTEAGQLYALAEAERLDAFYALWTLKEAACKAADVSLWESLHSTNFDLRNGRFNSQPPLPSEDWHFMSAGIEPGWRVAVAARVAVNTLEIECWRLTAAKQWQEQSLVQQIFLTGK